jgi:hypothetical protein
MNLQLSDDRVDAMRRKVLDDVDSDIAHRGRRARKALAGGLGALALLTVIGVTIPSVTSGPDDVVASQTADNGTSGGVALPEPATAQQDGPISDLRQSAPSKEIAPIPPIPPDQPPLTAPGSDREVITTGSATVTVTDPADRANEFTSWVEKHGGRVDGRNESRDDEGHTSAHVLARVPSKQVGAAVKELRTYGTVESVDLHRDDVTAQGQDLDARIKALKISIERLEGILERAGSSSEVVEAESALSARQQELESLLLQRRSLDDQVSLSTLSVSFTQESKPGTVAPGGFRGGLVTGWNALVDTVNAVVTAAGAAVPWLGIGAVVGLLWWGIRRARKDRRP